MSMGITAYLLLLQEQLVEHFHGSVQLLDFRFPPTVIASCPAVLPLLPPLYVAIMIRRKANEYA